jgi:hypothetical protein
MLPTIAVSLLGLLLHPEDGSNMSYRITGALFKPRDVTSQWTFSSSHRSESL